jgi:hypothetical protein
MLRFQYAPLYFHSNLQGRRRVIGAPNGGRFIYMDFSMHTVRDFANYRKIFKPIKTKDISHSVQKMDVRIKVIRMNELSPKPLFSPPHLFRL